jgi:hypothetical protein
MARDLPGTPDHLVINGNTYFYMGDADPIIGKPKFANNPLAHSGGTMRQMVRQDTGSAPHRIKANTEELINLKAAAESAESTQISWENRAGDFFQCTGFISFEGASAQNGSVEVSIYPETDWEPFGG